MAGTGVAAWAGVSAVGLDADIVAEFPTTTFWMPTIAPGVNGTEVADLMHPIHVCACREVFGVVVHVLLVQAAHAVGFVVVVIVGFAVLMRDVVGVTMDVVVVGFAVLDLP